MVQKHIRQKEKFPRENKFKLNREMPNTNLRDFAASRMSITYTSFGNIWQTTWTTIIKQKRKKQ